MLHIHTTTGVCRRDFLHCSQVKEGECEVLRHKLEVLEAKYSALEYQLKADEEEHSTRCSIYDGMHVCVNYSVHFM